VVSGAGPTVLSLESVGADIRRDAAGAGWRVVPLAVAASGVQITRGSLSKVEF
ncbi:MAG: homoserine kinase, partial [Thermobifida sp.]|nr:homoserine kinase [Thermobifida sp.]